MNRILLVCLLCSLGLFLTYCNEIKDVVLPHTELIFPNESGKMKVMQVWDTTFNTAGITEPEVDRYFKKEELGEEETDLLGRSIRKVKVYRSEIDLGQNFEFAIDRIWYQYVEPVDNADYFAERVQENQRVLVLKFPVHEAISWNGNLFNDSDTEIFRYQDIDTTVVIQGQTFENSVLVIHSADTNNVINNRFAYEIYAPNIGMIKRFDRTIVNDGPNGEFNPAKSRIYVEEIVEHN